MRSSVNISNRRVIQVFEHQHLRVGEQSGEAKLNSADFEAMCRFANTYGEKYFQVLHQAIRFRNYVGVIQIGALTLEILPKADSGVDSDKGQWQGVLLAMLKVCRLIKPEKSATAPLGFGRHMLFDLYIELFLNEVERLLRAGLLRSYCRNQRAENSLKGKLIFKEQIRKHQFQQQRFFCAYDIYTFDHPLNQLIGQALKALRTFALPSSLQTRLSKVLEFFPALEQPASREVTMRNWRAIRFHRKTERYRQAIDFAYLILLNYSPDIRNGQFPMLALVFDMNLLFQEYVYRKLVMLSMDGLEVRRQVTTSFWQRSRLQPDMVLKFENQRIVLDTKWKILKKAQPSIEDLRQMFVYGKYFRADRAVLLYPQLNIGQKDLGPLPFSPFDEQSRELSCHICFVPVLKNGQLNLNLGQEILERITF